MGFLNFLQAQLVPRANPNLRNRRRRRRRSRRRSLLRSPSLIPDLTSRRRTRRGRPRESCRRTPPRWGCPPPSSPSSPARQESRRRRRSRPCRRSTPPTCTRSQLKKRYNKTTQNSIINGGINFPCLAVACLPAQAKFLLYRLPKKNQQQRGRDLGTAGAPKNTWRRPPL